MRISWGSRHSEGIADLAFALVVLAAYFTTFSTVRNISVSWLLVIILLGIFYIAIGVYGFAFCVESRSFSIKVLYFAVQIFIGNIILYLGGATGFNAIVLLPLAGHSVVMLNEYWRYAMNGVMAASYAIALRMITGGWDVVLTNVPLFVAAQIFILVFTQMAVSEARSKNEIHQLAENLALANQQLRKYAIQAEQLATEKERIRVAREIHDGIGHHITALNMQVKAAMAVMATDTRRSMSLLQNAEELSQQVMLDIRQSVSALRESTVDEGNLPQSLQKLLSSAEAAGLSVKFQVTGEPRILNPETSLTLYRVVQESISNTLKHAQATHYQLSLDFSDSEFIHLWIQDDGIGTNEQNGGFGLIGMRERVHLVDGMIDIQSTKGHGFSIDVQLPG
jgi:signal transduction histidine kinase